MKTSNHLVLDVCSYSMSSYTVLTSINRDHLITTILFERARQRVVVLWKYFTIQVVWRAEYDDDGIIFSHYLVHLLFLLLSIYLSTVAQFMQGSIEFS